MTDTSKPIPFSPPDITEAEIEAASDALRSGWITTGPRTKELERKLCAYTGADGFACLNSATAALECALRLLGIGPGDEVITSAYTYTASASPIHHVGAKIILVDTAPGSFEMDYMALSDAITDRTKAIIPVDLGGRMCDYGQLRSMLQLNRGKWHPSTDVQRLFDRVPIVADGAHALGATWHGIKCGSVADFTAFSFHAVKNFTTAEGGGLAWHLPQAGMPASPMAWNVPQPASSVTSEELYRRVMLLSLHGQSKDALAKARAGAWEYDIEFLGWKYNMTDVMAAIGLVQLERYPSLLARRRELIERYERGLADLPVTALEHFGRWGESSGHLMLVRLNGRGARFRNRVIELMAEAGVATNVHYKPLPLMTAYRDLGFDIKDFPNAYNQFRNEITLPLHTLLADEDVDRVIAELGRALQQAEAEGVGTDDAKSAAEERLAAYIKRMDETGGWSGDAAPRAFAVGDEERPVSPEEIAREMEGR